MDVVRRGLLMKVFVLGVSGMLGSAVFRVLSARAEFETFGTARSGFSRRLVEAAARQLQHPADLAHRRSGVLGDLQNHFPTPV